MRTIIVTGNLAADPEILTKQDGTNYTKLRIGNHEYSDGKDGNTKWFTAFYPRTDGIVNALKKGSGVLVMGDYTDNIYQSQTRGADIDRIISVHKIDFFSTGTKRDDNQPAQAKSASPAPTEAKTTVAKKTTAKVSTPTATQSAEGVDDLPF